MAQLPDQARVVIIGGGAVGASTLYHLAKAGWTDLRLHLARGRQRADVFCIVVSDEYAALFHRAVSWLIRCRRLPDELSRYRQHSTGTQ